MRFYISILFLLVGSGVFARQNDTVLKTYSKDELLKDYDLAVSSLKESHPGLYWYTNYFDYEEIFKNNRDKIKDGMNSYQFFRILCLITSADKEGHSSVNSSKDVSYYFRHKAKYLPLKIKTINKKLYVINDIGNYKTKGKIIKSINDVAIESILKKIFNHKSSLSDGYTTTGKFKSIDRYGFASNYFDYIHDFTSDDVPVTLIDSKDGIETKLLVSLISRDSLLSIAKTTNKKEKKGYANNLYKFRVYSNTKTAIITFNSFSYSSYEKYKLNFKSVIDSLFYIIKKKKIKNLIIDIRNNTGGSEGAEDYLYSYMAKDEYKKYEYVESKNFKYSFMNYTNYKGNTEVLYNMLEKEHYLSKDGRYLRKANILTTELPQKKPFRGKLYVLISGKTYSGGSEFASIVKSMERGVLIGEETGGGFYGQTSGLYLYLLLPSSQMKIRIPLLKFSTNFKSADIPFGRGVMPAHKIAPNFKDYIQGKDAELEYTLNLINNKK